MLRTRMLSTASCAMVQPTPSMMVARSVSPLAPATLTDTRPAPGRLTRVLAARGRAVAGDEAGHEGAVPVLVIPRVVATGQVDAVDQAAGEVGQRGDAGVEHGDVDARARVALRPQLGGATLLGEDGGRSASRSTARPLDVHRDVGCDHEAGDGLEHPDLRRVELGRDGVDEGKVGDDRGTDLSDVAEEGGHDAARFGDDVLGGTTPGNGAGFRRSRNGQSRCTQRGDARQRCSTPPDTPPTVRKTGPPTQNRHPWPPPPTKRRQVEGNTNTSLDQRPLAPPIGHSALFAPEVLPAGHSDQVHRRTVAVRLQCGWNLRRTTPGPSKPGFRPGRPRPTNAQFASGPQPLRRPFRRAESRCSPPPAHRNCTAGVGLSGLFDNGASTRPRHTRSALRSPGPTERRTPRHHGRNRFRLGDRGRDRYSDGGTPASGTGDRRRRRSRTARPGRSPHC